MTRTRTWSAAVAVGCLLVVLAAWFLAIGPKRAEAADLRERTSAQLSANDMTRLRTRQLQAQYRKLPAQRAELDVITRQMPAAPGLAAVLRTLTAMAAVTGVDLVSVTPSPPAPPAAGAATAPAAGPTLQPLSTAIVLTGDYASAALFLQKLQAAAPSPRSSSLERAFLVQSVKLVPDSTTTPGASTPAVAAGTGRVQLTVTGQLFVMTGLTVPDVPDVPAVPAVPVTPRG